MKIVYALILRRTATDEEFGARIPAIMDWLRDLRRRGKLLGCGGGGAETWNGGLTLIEAATPEEAIEEARRSPQASLGTTEVFEWEVYFADLAVPRDF